MIYTFQVKSKILPLKAPYMVLLMAETIESITL